MSVVSIPKLWMHYLVGVSHFAKYRTNRLYIVSRKQINTNKCPKIACSSVVKKIIKWPGINAQMRINTKSEPLLEGHLMPVPAKFGRRPFPRSSVISCLHCLQNDRTNERMTENDHITSALLAEVIIIILIIIIISKKIIIIIICYRPSDSKDCQTGHL